MSTDFNNHLATGYVAHSHSNSHRLTNSSVYCRNSNLADYSRMFVNCESSAAETSIILISLIRSHNNGVNTSNISIKGVITISIRSVNHIINSNNNTSRVSNIEYKVMFNLNKLSSINNNSSVQLISYIECCTGFICYIIFIIAEVVCMSSVVSDRKCNCQDSLVFTVDCNSVIVSSNFNNHLAGFVISHRYGNCCVLADVNNFRSCNNACNFRSVLVYDKCCVVGSCEVVVVFSHTCSDIVKLSNSSVEVIFAVSSFFHDNTIDFND